MLLNFKAMLKQRLKNAVGHAELMDYLKQVESHLNSIDDKLNKMPIKDTRGEFENYINKIVDIRIESTNHCTYKCAMCPRDTMTRPEGIQSLDDFALIIRNISKYLPNYSCQFHMHDYGEALLDKNLSRKIKILRDIFFHCNISVHSTIGYSLQENFFEKLVECGLNTIFISCYGIDRQSYKDIHGVDRFDLVMHNMKQLSKIALSKANKFSVIVKGPFIKTNNEIDINNKIIANYDISKFKNIILGYGFDWHDTELHNFVKFNFNQLSPPLMPCSIHDGALSRVLNINWDLKVVPCCMVTNQEIILGDLKEKSLYEMFYDAPWSNFREAHKKMALRDAYPHCWKCHQDTNTFMRDSL